MKQTRIRDLSYIALFSIIIAICSWATIPAPVPFTLQTFGVMCTVGLLGGKRGFVAILVYTLIGVVGIPVFSGFGAGIGTLFGATGGYIVGFIYIPIVYLILDKIFGVNAIALIASFVIGLAICYAFGTMWFMYIYLKTTGTISLASALSMCVVPFIIPDVAKICAAFLVVKHLKKYIKL